MSLWSSLKATVIESTLESRFGKVWALRATRLAGARRAPARGSVAGASAVPRIVAGGAGARRRDGSATAEGPAIAAGPATARRRRDWRREPRRHPSTGLAAGGVGTRSRRTWRSRRRSPVTPASRARRACSSRPTCSMSCPPACGSGGSPVCCWPCRLRHARLRGGRAQPAAARQSAALLHRLALAAVIAIAATGVIQAYIDVRIDPRAAAHHLRRADHRQDRVAGGADRASAGSIASA